MPRRLSVILCLLVAICASAQHRVFIRGYVLDSTKHGIDIVNVAAIGTTDGTMTNAQGYYEFSIEPHDSVHLVFSCIGYKTQTHTLKLTGKAAYTFSVTLQVDVTALDEIEVHSDRHQPNTMVSIETQNLHLVPNAGNNGIEGLIKTYAGVSSHNELSAQYSVRGGNFDENCVYINDVEVYRPQLIRSGLQEGLSIINPDMVGAVNFSAGGFSARYGDKMSSVLDVTYKKPKHFEASLSGSLLGTSAYVGASGKRFTQMHGFRYKTTQYLLGTLDTKADYDTWCLDYQTYMTYALSPKWTLSLLGNFAQNIYRFRPDSTGVEFGTAAIARQLDIYHEGQERDRFRTLFGTLGLHYDINRHNSVKWSVSAFNIDERETYDILNNYMLSETIFNGSNRHQGTVLGTGSFQQHARNHLSTTVLHTAVSSKTQVWLTSLHIGVDYQREIVNDRMNEWERRDSADYSLPHTGDAVRLFYSLKSNNALSSNRMQGYIEDTYTVYGKHATWNFNAGAHVSYWSFNNEWLVSPRASATWLPKWKHEFNFRLAIGMYYQAPFYKEIRMQQTDAQGNSTIVLNNAIKSQRAMHLLFGVDYYFRLWHRPFKFTAEAYYKPADNVISYYVDNLRVRYSGVNDAKAYTVGIDLKLFGEFVPGTDSWISLSWMRSQEDLYNDSYHVYSNTGRLIGTVFPGYIARPNEQRYSFSLFFQDYFPNHPEYKVSLMLIWADGLPFGPPNSERYAAVLRSKAYRRVDIGAARGFVHGRERFMSRQNVVQSFWINMELFNLFNIKNTNSNYWITDVSGMEYSAPIYLTGFRANLKLTVNF